MRRAEGAPEVGIQRLDVAVEAADFAAVQPSQRVRIQVQLLVRDPCRWGNILDMFRRESENVLETVWTCHNSQGTILA